MSERIDRARSSASKFAEVIAPLDEVDFLYSPIDQNSAKFSLADRQIPVRVAPAATARERLDTLRNVPVPPRNGGPGTIPETGKASWRERGWPSVSIPVVGA